MKDWLNEIWPTVLYVVVLASGMASVFVLIWEIGH